MKPKITSYPEWEAAVDQEFRKLYAVKIYLNDKGKERLSAYSLLSNLSNFCTSATELLDWTITREELTPDECKELDGFFCGQPLKRLREVADLERKESAS